MQNKLDKLGIVIAMAVTAGALAFVGSVAANPENRSLQPQGEMLLERTVNELKATPSSIENSVDKVDDIVSDVKEDVTEILESDTIGEAADETIDELTDALPEVPIVVKQADGKLLEHVTIPQGTSVPGCEIANSCYIPATAVIRSGGEVIWTNDDNAAHTVTSGNPRSGPNILFDSGLLMPGDTYSIKLDLPQEYDYFCLVHPWMTGKVIVK